LSTSTRSLRRYSTALNPKMNPNLANGTKN